MLFFALFLTLIPPDQRSLNVWYLHHSGWMVETDNHLLIFDYFPDELNQENKEAVSSLLSQMIEGANKHVLFIISHEHKDHYSNEIYQWKDLDRVQYVYGWDYNSELDSYISAPPDSQNVTVGSLKIIRSIPATDLGSGFLITVDDVVIFHSGDHAQWASEYKMQFRSEVDKVAEYDTKIDLAFMPISRGTCGDVTTDLTEGVVYTLNKLKPRFFFPMHVRCVDKIQLYQSFTDSIKDRFSMVQFRYGTFPGEAFSISMKQK
ncbi:MBL fold metallo-hydrolase [Ekhidna sp.]|uniref:MBL fold metallo-hydrolase n=1 Tax=Ekhidna sp. TaxID=2608089 RepID=UPI0032EF58A4